MAVAAEEIVDLARLRLASDDVLVVRFRNHVSADHALSFRDYLVDALKAAGIANRVLLVSAEVDLAVLERDALADLDVVESAA